MKTLCVIFTTLIIWTGVSYAEDINKFTATTYINLGCDFEEAKKQGLEFNKWFREYDEVITQYSLSACKQLYENESKVVSINDYWPKEVRKEILMTILDELSQNFKLDDEETLFKRLNMHYNEWLLESDFFVQDEKQIYPPNFDHVPNEQFNGNKYYLTTPTRLTRLKPDMFELNYSQNTFCTKQFKGAANCIEVIEEFKTITDKLTTFQKLSVIQKHNAYVKINNSNWNKFAENSRFQTFIDVSFTSLIYRGHLSNSKDIITPPPLQLFAIRPGIVYEHFNHANKGEKDELAISLEWVGFNAWDLKIPFGVSVASIYADRKNGKSLAHGLMFHVNNSFSFGVASRGSDDTSIFVNVEFMDWFGEKQNKLMQYKKYQF